MTTSCFEDDNPPIAQDVVPPLVRERLDQKISEYYSDRKKICMLDILVRAEDMVDSIIINEIKVRMIDDLIFPERPQRPFHPGLIILDDTTKIVRPE